MQISVVFQRSSQPIEDGRAARPVSASLPLPSAREFGTGGSCVDPPLRQGNLVSVNRVKRFRQLALGGWQISLGERSLGERLATEPQVRPLAGCRRESTQRL